MSPPPHWSILRDMYWLAGPRRRKFCSIASHISRWVLQPEDYKLLTSAFGIY